MDELQFAKDAQINLYIYVAMTCWAGYEWLVMLPDEMQFIWRRRLTLPRILFACARIFGLGLLSAMTALSISSLSSSGCLLLSQLRVLAQLITSLPADGLLLWRVVALFVHRKKIRNALIVYFFVEKTVEFIAVCFVSRLTVVVRPYHGIPGCFTQLAEKGSDTFFAAGLLTATFIFNLTWLLLTIYNPHTAYQRRAGSKSPVLDVLLRGGTTYFALYLIMLCVSGFVPVWYGDRPGLKSTAIPVLVAGYPVAACRLYLHLKRSRHRDITTTDFAHAKTPSLGIISWRDRRRGESYDSWSDESYEEPEHE